MSDTATHDSSMAGPHDFAEAKPNPLADYFRQEGVRQLDADVREAFPDSESVNTALRLLMRVAREAGRQELPKAS